MPIAAPQKDAQAHLIQHYHHLLPKPTGCHRRVSGQLSPTSLVASQDIYNADVAELGQIANISASPSSEDNEPFFSTRSPPIINLSPNLSPTDQQRTSPFYDLRESTRRRSLQDSQNSYPLGPLSLQVSPQLYSGIITEDLTRKSESPNRKRRKTSNSIIDLTNSPSPPPPHPWDIASEAGRVTRLKNSSNLRITSEQHSNTAKARRSPGTRRRTRDRNTYRQAEPSPDRRAFHPPNTAANQMHPSALHHQSQQPVMMEHDQVPTTAPVTVGPYAIPICTGQHHFPVCTSAHIPVCTSQPTWSIPACGMQIPSCGMHHIPACGLPQMPLPGPLNPMMPHSQGAPHLSHQHHITAGPHFNPNPARHQQENIHLLQEHRPAFPIPPTLHSHPLNHSPVLLQEPAVHPTPHDIYGPFQRYYARQRTVGRNGRLRSLAPGPPSLPPPPPPIYPGFILHFLAMLGNPPVPPYSRDIHDEATEVENYEVSVSTTQALLNLAERLGEAKPRGLTKTEIKQLPAYQFNSGSSCSQSDQTSCVVCMCDFENRQLLRVLPCSHEFHSKCVDRWLRTNRTCPICRADTTEVGSPSD